jgi:hypothetical protein
MCLRGPLAQQKLRKPADLLGYVPDQVVERDDPDKCPRLVDDRSPTYACGLHSIEHAYEIFVLAGRHWFGRHDVADGDRVDTSVSPRKDSNDNVAVGQQANGEELTILLVHHDDASDMCASHPCCDFVQRFVRASGRDSPIAELSGSGHEHSGCRSLAE